MCVFPVWGKRSRTLATERGSSPHVTRRSCRSAPRLQVLEQQQQRASSTARLRAMYDVYARLVRPIAIFLGGQPWLPRFNKQIVAMDRFVQRPTRGRVGFVRIAGLPGLPLPVVGRTTAIPSRTPLLSVPHQHVWLLAGPHGGDPTPPAR